MLVKKGQNNKIHSVHNNRDIDAVPRVIYDTSRFISILEIVFTIAAPVFDNLFMGCEFPSIMNCLLSKTYNVNKH